MSLYGYGSSLSGYVDRERREVFAELARRGVAQAKVHFSGGNDEGGINDVELLKADGSKVELLDQWDCHPPYDVYDKAQGKYVPAPDERSDQHKADWILWEAFEAPMEAEYGGFGGEFYVSGTYTWDVTARKVTVTTDTRGYTYHEDSREI